MCFCLSLTAQAEIVREEDEESLFEKRELSTPQEIEARKKRIAKERKKREAARKKAAKKKSKKNCGPGGW